MNIEELKQYAMDQITAILESDMEKVSALAFQGGIGRGKFDSLSDIDLLIAFDKKEDSKGVVKGEKDIDGKKWSIFHLSFDKVTPKQWREKLRYVYGYETLIFYDRTGRLQELCNESKLSKEEQQERTVYKIKKMGNRGITYKGIVNEEWRGIYWGDRHDLWVIRGDNFAAHMRLSQAVELLIDLMYSLNGLPIPSPKWKHHLVTGLKWMPTDFKQNLYSVSCIHDMSESDVDRRYRLLITLVTQCINHAIYLHLLPEDMGSYYFPKFSTHSDNTED
jgi:predicted nucleotidyltransferase